jgi:hypothetical protein
VDCLWREFGLIVEINGTPAQVAATILAAIHGPGDFEYFEVRGPGTTAR